MNQGVRRYGRWAVGGLGVVAGLVGYALDAAEVADLPLATWEWVAAGNVLVLGAGASVLAGLRRQNLELQQELLEATSPGLDLAVEVPRLDHDWYRVGDDGLGGETWLSFRLPSVFIVNRSRTERASLTFALSIRIDNFDRETDVTPDMDHKLYKNKELDDSFMYTPVELEPQSSRRGNLLVAQPFGARRWTTDGVLLLSNAMLVVRDHVSGQQIEVAVPGRAETASHLPSG